MNNIAQINFTQSVSIRFHDVIRRLVLLDSKLTRLFFKKRVILLWIVIITLVLWRAIIYYFLPYSGVDGTWSLGRTFSLLRGNLFSDSLGNGFLTPDLSPYFYAILTAPAYLLLPFKAWNIFAWNLILVLLVAFQIYSFAYKDHTLSLSSAFVLMVAFLCSTYTYGLRPELLISVLMIFMLRLLTLVPRKISPNVRAVLAGMLATSIGLSHPVGGIVVVVLVFMIFWDQKLSCRSYWIFCITTASLVLFFYAPVIMIDVQKWWYQIYYLSISQDTHSFSFTTFLKYSAYTPFIYISPAAAIIKARFQLHRRLHIWIKEGIYWGIMIGVISLFGRSYYFPYLLVFILWRLTRLPRVTIPATVIVGTLLIAPFLTYYTPTIQLIENPVYSQTLHEVLKDVESYAPIAEKNLVWVSPYTVMPIMEKPGARIFFSYYRRMASEGMTFSSEDVILYIHPEEYNTILKNLDVPESSLIVREIIPPVPGLLRPGTLFQERDSSLGLWEIRMREP